MKTSLGNVFLAFDVLPKPKSSKQLNVNAELSVLQVSVGINVQKKMTFSQEAMEVAAMVASSPGLGAATRKSMLRVVALVDEYLTGADKERALSMVAALVVLEEMAAEKAGRSYRPWSLKEAVEYMEEVRKQANPEMHGDIKAQINIEITTLQIQISAGEAGVCRLV